MAVVGAERALEMHAHAERSEDGGRDGEHAEHRDHEREGAKQQSEGAEGEVNDVLTFHHLCPSRVHDDSCLGLASISY